MAGCEPLEQQHLADLYELRQKLGGRVYPLQQIGLEILRRVLLRRGGGLDGGILLAVSEDIPEGQKHKCGLAESLRSDPLIAQPKAADGD